MIRRASAIVLSAFMLHLNLVRADVACASHETAPAQAATHESAAMHHHADANPSGVGEDASCQTPVQRDCCQAVTSCAPSMGVLSDGGSAAVPLWHTVIASALQLRPHTRTTAPEPPPPRL